MATETNAGGSLACPRCGKPATDLSIKIRKCTRCGCTLAMASPQTKLWDENAMLRLALVALWLRLGRGPHVEISREDLERAANANATVTTDGREARVVVRFGS